MCNRINIAHAITARFPKALLQGNRATHGEMAFAEKGRFHQGVSLWGSRGKRDVLRMLLRAQKSITTRSRPTPKPPCGGAPYLSHAVATHKQSLQVSDYTCFI